SFRHSGSPIHGKFRRCRLSHVISCVQSQLITYHQSTDDQCALMICVAPVAPPVSVHQCQVSMLIHATCQCPSVPHQSHISVPISATSMPQISAHLSCLSVSPISASQCRLSVPPISVHQCCLSVLPNS
ncbi:unnamed protein product, partial [Staurois parvus]